MNIKIHPQNSIKFSKSSNSTYISIKNSNNYTVAYVIKTTEPNFFTVKPNIGVLDKYSETICLVQREIEFKNAKFRIEIYNFHWQAKNKEDIRNYITESKMKPFMTKILEIEETENYLSDIEKEFNITKENKFNTKNFSEQEKEEDFESFRKKMFEKIKKSKNKFGGSEGENWEILMYLTIFMSFLYLEFKIFSN